jgi:hypothetical protein
MLYRPGCPGWPPFRPVLCGLCFVAFWSSLSVNSGLSSLLFFFVLFSYSTVVSMSLFSPAYPNSVIMSSTSISFPSNPSQSQGDRHWCRVGLPAQGGSDAHWTKVDSTPSTIEDPGRSRAIHSQIDWRLHERLLHESRHYWPRP